MEGIWTNWQMKGGELRLQQSNIIFSNNNNNNEKYECAVVRNTTASPFHYKILLQNDLHHGTQYDRKLLGEIYQLISLLMRILAAVWLLKRQSLLNYCPLCYCYVNENIIINFSICVIAANIHGTVCARDHRGIIIEWKLFLVNP